MKKVIIFILIVALALCAGCRMKGSDSSPIKVVTQAPRVEPSPAPVSELPKIWKNEDGQTSGDIFSCDVNKDGKAELLRYQPMDENTEMPISFYVAGSYVNLDFFFPETVFICDLNGKDGVLDILVDGDVASSDYVTYHLRYANNELTILSEIYGWLHDIDGEQIIMGEIVDMLGTWGAYRPYVLDESGLLVPATQTLSISGNSLKAPFEQWRAILTVRTLPVTIGGVKTALEAGVKLTPTAFERGAWADFITEDGIEGRIEFMLGENEYELFIGGVAESEYFEELMYAG